LTFQAAVRSLSDAEVNDVYATLVTEIGRRFEAEIRGA
jgi:hypothetical protein